MTPENATTCASADQSCAEMPRMASISSMRLASPAAAVHLLCTRSVKKAKRGKIA